MVLLFSSPLLFSSILLSIMLIYFTENFVFIIHPCDRSLSSENSLNINFYRIASLLVFFILIGMAFLYFCYIFSWRIKLENIFSLICFDLRFCAFQVPIIPFQNIFFSSLSINYTFPFWWVSREKENFDTVYETLEYLVSVLLRGPLLDRLLKNVICYFSWTEHAFKFTHLTGFKVVIENLEKGGFRKSKGKPGKVHPENLLKVREKSRNPFQNAWNLKIF